MPCRLEPRRRILVRWRVRVRSWCSTSAAARSWSRTRARSTSRKPASRSSRSSANTWRSPRVRSAEREAGRTSSCATPTASTASSSTRSARPNPGRLGSRWSRSASLPAALPKRSCPGMRRPCEGAGVRELAAKVEAADEAEDLADGRPSARAQPLGEVGFGLLEKPGSLSGGVRRRQEKDAGRPGRRAQDQPRRSCTHARNRSRGQVFAMREGSTQPRVAW